MDSGRWTCPPTPHDLRTGLCRGGVQNEPHVLYDCPLTKNLRWKYDIWDGQLVWDVLNMEADPLAAYMVDVLNSLGWIFYHMIALRNPTRMDFLQMRQWQIDGRMSAHVKMTAHAHSIGHNAWNFDGSCLYCYLVHLKKMRELCEGYQIHSIMSTETPMGFALLYAEIGHLIAACTSAQCEHTSASMLINTYRLQQLNL